MIILKESTSEKGIMIIVGSRKWNNIEDVLRDHCDSYRKYELIDMINWAKIKYPHDVIGFVKDKLTGESRVSLDDIVFATSLFADFQNYEDVYDSLAYI